MFLHNLLNVLVQIANRMGLQKKMGTRGRGAYSTGLQPRLRATTALPDEVTGCCTDRTLPQMEVDRNCTSMTTLIWFLSFQNLERQPAGSVPKSTLLQSNSMGKKHTECRCTLWKTQPGKMC
jgi:hypothetical protein